MQKFVQAVGFALEGIRWVYKEHPNFKIHSIVSIFIMIIAYLLGFTYLEWAVLILTILLVFSAEMVNTAVEEVTDLITIKWAKQAKIAKDVAAGMVLVSALGSVVIGFLLFIPKLCRYF